MPARLPRFLSSRRACLALGLLLGGCRWVQGGAIGQEAGFDLFVAGCEDGSQAAGTIWENGRPTPLARGSGVVRPTALAASGRDLYAAGWADAPAVPTGRRPRPARTALVWKNGAATALTSGTTWAVAMAVTAAGEDVYVAGTEEERATLWKNGRGVPLATQNVSSWARAVALAGTDVLVAGDQWSGVNGAGVAMLWMNGRAIPLTDGTRNACARAIAVAGADVYVAGYESNGRVNVAMVWKNGKALPPLTDGTRDAEAEAVAVAGTDVIAAGSEAVGAELKTGGGPSGIRMPVATVWKNGVPTRLADGTRFSWAHSVAVAGAGIYAAGEELNSSDTNDSASRATVWKLGANAPVATRLSSGRTVASAPAICVVRRGKGIETGGPAVASAEGAQPGLR